MEPSLTICVIARNEEKNLPRALRSVRAVADEMIVADTGSTDGTEAVARELGAAVHHFHWRADFSAARNFAISQARGDWIFVLDADEELLPESAEELRASLKRPDALAYFVRRQDLRNADRLDDYSMMWQLRVFRRRDDLRFQGRCHPHFDREISGIEAKTGLRVLPSTITLRHYGYVTEMVPAKLRRGAQLMELELRERPGQLYYLIEYGRTLLLLGDEARGRDMLNQAAAQILPLTGAAEPPLPLVAQLLEYLLHIPTGQLPIGYTRQLVEDLARRWFPTSPPLLWLLARQAAEASRFAEAESMLRQLVQMGRDHSYDPWISFDPRIIGADAKFNLAVCLLRQTNVEEARTIFTELASDPNHAAQAGAGLQAIEQYERHTGGGRF